MNAITDVTANFDKFAAQKGVDDYSTAMSQWFNRPPDERYTSLDEMLAMLERRTMNTTEPKVMLGDVRPILHDGGLAFALGDQVVMPTHHAFTRLCAEAKGVPTDFIRKLGANPRLAVECLEWGLRSAVDETPEKELMTMMTKGELRSVTSTQFGRVWDLDAVRKIQQMIGSSGRWVVPTAFARPGFKGRGPEVTKQSTTLYAGDGDIFLFLVDERTPIQCGFLPNGEPDMYSRGFVFRNSEVGGTCCEVLTFLYCWICENRSIRGKKAQDRMKLRHTKRAPELVMDQMLPALQMFIDGKATGVADGFDMLTAREIEQKVNAMKAVKLKGWTDPLSFLSNLDFGPKMSQAIIGKVIDEEGHELETLHDAWAGMTAMAKTIPHQDVRLELEVRAGEIFDKVTV